MFCPPGHWLSGGFLFDLICYICVFDKRLVFFIIVNMRFVLFFGIFLIGLILSPQITEQEKTFGSSMKLLNEQSDTIIKQAVNKHQVRLLIDSLTLAKSKSYKIKLSHKIAVLLSDKNPSRALYYLNYANGLAKEVGTKDQLFKSLKKTGDYYYYKDALDVALDYYLKSLAYCDLDRPSIDRLKIENNIAVIYARLKNMKKAIHYFNESYMVSKALKDSSYIAKTLNNLGNVYLKLDLKNSYKYYKKCLSYLNQYDNPNLRTVVYTNVARNYTLQQKNDSALVYYNKALQMLNTSPLVEKKTQGWVYNALAQYYFNTQQIDLAIVNAKKAILAYDDKFSFDSQEIVQILYKAYLKNENYKAATQYFTLYNEISDSLKVYEKLVNIQRLTLQNEFESHKKNLKLQEAEKHINYLLVGGSVTVILLVALIGIISYKNKWAKAQLKYNLLKSKENELNSTIELKNKVLVSKTMYEIHRNKIVQDVIEKLKVVQRKAVKKETKLAINEVSRQLENRDIEKIWKEFQIGFEKVYVSFFDELNIKHPDLTRREKRLCALLKLNMTSKEIAQISGLSIKSIENSRTRLRKKMGLTNAKVDLSAYLYKFG